MEKKNTFHPQCVTFSQMNLIFNARIYYRRLTTWTRAYIVSSYFGIGTAEDLFDRLYLESLEIGKIAQIIFGRVYSEKYSQYTCQYAIAFRELIDAQLNGDAEAVNRSINRLYQNVAERAEFLEALNPYWGKEEYIGLFNEYIRLTVENANAIAAEDYRKDIELYDSLTAHTNKMGDVFAQGVYDYITSGQHTPDSLNGECITAEQMNVIYDIRMFWFELVTWIRRYMLSRYLGISSVEEVSARLRQVPVDYTNSLRQVFGEQVATDLLEAINAYLDLLEDFITAQIEGDIDEIDGITRLLYENADQRAALISSVNPYWDYNEWRNRLYNNLRITIDESTTLLAKDYARNIDISSRLLDLAEDTSIYFAQGLYSYFSSLQDNTAI
ncbi:MAG: hypothetical protein PHC91_08700 [Eubacteriales bacterium]|nr:hypothetical protein [Eubacteriales bacterium]